MDEIWKDISGYEGRYHVSNHGRVKSCTRADCNNRLVKERILHTRKSKVGYLQVTLFCDGAAKSLTVHRLVATAFIQNLENKPEVNHIDGDKHNNHVDNLEWVTSRENHLHAFRELGRKVSWLGKLGKDSHLSKPVMQFTKGGVLILVFAGLQEASRETGVNPGNISSCCRGERKSAGGFIWKHKMT